jgi:cellulose biosynthesis protein BcsQ
VKLKEAPVFGRTIFHHAPSSSGAEDYLSLAREVMCRIGIAVPTEGLLSAGGAQ